MIGRTVHIILPSTVLAAILVSTAGFSPIILPSSRGRISFTNHPRHNHDDARASSSSSFRSPSSEDDALRLGRSSRRQSSPTAGILRRASLSMTSGNDGRGGGGGPGLVTAAFAIGVLIFFAVSAFAPLIDYASTSPSANDINLGDSVVTRQDGNKLSGYQSKFDVLSPAKVQEKLRNLPVFYLSTNDDDGTSVMGDRNAYLSFRDADNAVKRASSRTSVKATTVDQVMYPLILGRGGTPETTSAVAPAEIKNALAAAAGTNGGGKSYGLVPSEAASIDARDMGLKEGDIPLYVVERLAFASDDGRPQVPLFTERGDAMTSYARLRESGGNKLPEEPTIRTTSLLDVLDSMERGTRPAVGQLQFYGNADDVLKADEMLSR